MEASIIGGLHGCSETIYAERILDCPCKYAGVGGTPGCLVSVSEIRPEELYVFTG